MSALRSALSSVSVGRKLAVLSGTAILVSLTVGLLGLTGQNRLQESAQQAQVLEQAKAGLNHLDTRESELKVSGYRSLAEADVAAIAEELIEDAVTVTEAVNAVDALALPAELTDSFDAVKPEVEAFTEFIVSFVETAGSDQSAARAADHRVEAG